MKQKWPTRFIGEFVVIVLGVLVALGVDDWRQYRVDRELEAHLLARLADDLSADAADLAMAQTMAARRQWILHALVTDLGDGAADGQPALSPPDSLVNPVRVQELLRARGRAPQAGPLFREWAPTTAPLNTFEGYAEFDLADDSFQEMLVGGGLRILRDAAIRTRILAYYRTAEDMGENERRMAQYQPRLEAALASVGVALGDSLTLSELASRVARESSVGVEIRRAQTDVRYQLLFLGFIDESRSGLESLLAEVAGAGNRDG